jgi:hypothetical protein
MRPRSIILFERLFLAMVVLGLVNTGLAWETSVARLAVHPALRDVAPVLVLAAAIVSTLIYALLWYLIARRASRVAKWIYLALVAVSLLSFGQQLLRIGFRGDAASLIATLVLALMIASAVMLFRRDAAEWLGKRTGAADRPTA